MKDAYSTRQKGRQPRPISGVIDALMGSLGLRNSYHGWLVVRNWPQIVGDHIARRSRAIRFDEGVLYVAVPDAVWRQELAMQVENILREIRCLPYGRVIKKVRLVQGQKGT